MKFCAWALCLIAAAASGCAPTMIGPEVRPAFPARGKILFEGQPTPNARVKLFPADGGDGGRLPTARCQKDGTFQLSTYGDKDGAPEGRYIVTVTWNRYSADGESTNDLPERYAKPETSDIPIVEIKAGNNELPVIHLRR